MGVLPGKFLMGSFSSLSKAFLAFRIGGWANPQSNDCQYCVLDDRQ
jgi:hypothetical protein